MKRVLLLIYSASHFRELFRVARLLRLSQQYQPVMLFHDCYPTTPEDEATCYALGIPCYRKRERALIESPTPICETPPSAPAPCPPPVPPAPNPVPLARLDRLRRRLGRLVPSSWRGGKLHRRLRRCWDLGLGFIRGLRRHIRSSPRTLARAAVRGTRWAVLLPFRAWRRGLALAKRVVSLDRSLLAWLIHYRRHLNFARRVCAQLEVDYLVLAEDNVEYATGAFLRAARERHAPSLIIPYALAGPEEPAEVYFPNPAHSLERWGNWLLGKRHPSWVLEHRGRKLVRLPACRAFPLQWLGLSQPLPWVMNSSQADTMAVESEFMFNYYRRYGVPAEKMTVTGALSDDTLRRCLDDAHRHRAQLCRELRLDPELPILLCALPPLHSGSCRWGDDFTGYDDMLRFWVEGLKQTEGYNLVLSLHPSMNLDALLHLEGDGPTGPRIARWDTARLVPLCDVYVASISSTIRWAIACGKPVVNYDVYRFRFSDFSSAGGVLTMEEKKDFVDTLKRLTGDCQLRMAVETRQRACMQRWGNLDGRSGQRLLNLFAVLGGAPQTCPLPAKAERPLEPVLAHSSRAG
jgi:hypothetical protein